MLCRSGNALQKDFKSQLLVVLSLFGSLDFIVSRSFLSNKNAMTYLDLPFYRFIYEYLYSKSAHKVCVYMFPFSHYLSDMYS